MSELKNAADEKQVRAATDKEKRKKFSDVEDLRAVLRMAEGRRLLWRLMGHCKTFSSVYDNHGGRQSYNCGQQDVGHFLQMEIILADRKLYLTMQAEAGDENNG